MNATHNSPDAIAPFVSHFCAILEGTAKRNNHLKCKLFEASIIFPFKDYVYRFASYAISEEESFPQTCLISAYLIDKCGYPLTHRTIHKLFAASMRLVTKFYHDTYFSNSFFARVAGMSLDRFNDLEFTMFFKVHDAIYLSADRYSEYVKAFNASLPHEDQLAEKKSSESKTVS